MAGLVPANSVLDLRGIQDVDGRDIGGTDGSGPKWAGPIGCATALFERLRNSIKSHPVLDDIRKRN